MTKTVKQNKSAVKLIPYKLRKFNERKLLAVKQNEFSESVVNDVSRTDDVVVTEAIKLKRIFSNFPTQLSGMFLLDNAAKAFCFMNRVGWISFFQEISLMNGSWKVPWCRFYDGRL